MTQWAREHCAEKDVDTAIGYSVFRSHGNRHQTWPVISASGIMSACPLSLLSAGAVSLTNSLHSPSFHFHLCRAQPVLFSSRRHQSPSTSRAFLSPQASSFCFLVFTTASWRPKRETDLPRVCGNEERHAIRERPLTQTPSARVGERPPSASRSRALIICVVSSRSVATESAGSG